jgi:hypothetical protein
MNTIKKEDLKRYQDSGYCTVGDLKKFIEKHGIPDDSVILIQRIEDRYYEGVDISGLSGCETSEDGIYPPGSKSEGWGVYLKEGEQYYWQKETNRRMQQEIERRERGEDPEYPGIPNPSSFIVPLDETFMDQYHPAWSPIFYPDDPDTLFIDLHY